MHDERNDDRRAPSIVPLTRRRVLIGIGAAALAGALEPVSRVWAEYEPTKEETEGPFWVDEHLYRSDITVDPSDGSVVAGVPLALTILVVGGADDFCGPAPGVQVDVWHCDPAGRYSDESTNGTAGKKFLRGYQITDRDGIVRFQTIYPGWYPGRTIHIHLRVRAFSGTAMTLNFTTQLYFKDDVSAEVIANDGLYQRGTRTTFNVDDALYMHDTQIRVTSDGAGGYVGMVQIILDGLPETAGAAPTCGDADDNGSVTVTDGVQTLREAAGLASDCEPARCDVDASGGVTVTDGVDVLRAAAGLAVTLRCP